MIRRINVVKKKLKVKKKFTRRTNVVKKELKFKNCYFIR